MSFLLWLILAVIFLIIEVIAPNFLFASLTISAFLTSIIAYFTPQPFAQLPAFIILFLVFIFVVRPILKRKTKENSNDNKEEL